MRKNVILMAIFTIFLMVSTSLAQQKAADFLGNWKLADKQNNRAGKFDIKSVTLNVVQTDNNLVIERNTQAVNTAYSSTQREIYKISEDITTSLIGGQYGGVKSDQLRFLKNNKLELLSKLDGDNFVSSAIETWKLSEDGQTLTVKRRSRWSSKVRYELDMSPAYNFIEMVFTRQ